MKYYICGLMRKISFYLYLFLLIMAVSCGQFRKIEKNPDWRVKYEAALNYYEKKDYFKASSLFEQIMPIVRGLPEGEKVQFNMAYCQYYQKFYLLASEQFKTFYETYGRSSLVEEARYMFAYSLYASSPGSELDQSNSMQAMGAMQEFINRYPKSKFVDPAVESITIIQGKLEEKGFANARQYYKMRQYKAAIVSFESFRKNFPDSKFIEEAQYLIILSQFSLAQQSIYSKQEERYRGVIENYKQLIDKYPNSSFLRDAEKVYSESLEQLSKFRSNKNI